MSKKFRLFLLALSASVLILQLFTKSAAQDTELRVDAEHSLVHVNATIRNEQAAASPLTFLSGYAGTHFAIDRITNIHQDGASFTYDINLSSTTELAAAAAHVSWLTSEGGILRLHDLLPQNIQKRGLVAIYTPSGWKIATAERQAGPGAYWIDDLKNAVFYLNSDLRWYDASFPSATQKEVFLSVNISGRWQFTDAKARDVIADVFTKYSAFFEHQHSRGGYHLYLGKTPDVSGHSGWEADTRKGNVTILSSDTAFESQSLQQLHEQLRHEMFHLWIPEGVNLTGNYDWFFEGFAVYQSLKLGVAVNRIRFDDYLDTLSRAYGIDRRLGTRLSLIDASKNRWSGDNNTVVYARGMLVAFLCDLALLSASKGKASSDDIVREVYRRHSGDARATDGNEAVISILNDHRELVPIVDDHVSGTRQIDWSALIAAAGLQADTVSGTTALKVVQKPSGSQKSLLDKLGYNNWRKLTSK